MAAQFVGDGVMLDFAIPSQVRRWSCRPPPPTARHPKDLLFGHRLKPQFMLAVITAGKADRIIPVPFSTNSTLVTLYNWGVYGDLIKVDASHDFHSAWVDINMAYAILKKD